MKRLSPQMQIWYSKRFPGIEFQNGAHGVNLVWHGLEYSTENMTSIDGELVDYFEQRAPEPSSTPPFNHTHSEEAAYDEYKTADGKTRITVITERGQLKEIDIRVKVEEAGGATKNIKAGNDGLYVQFQCTTEDEVSQLLTALHAAVASIHKRSERKGPNNG